MRTLSAQAVVAGMAKGETLVWDAPLSFGGGLDASTGRVVDRSHPACGESVTGRILVMSGGRSSGSASSVLAEAIRRDTAPAAIILREPDPVITVGSIIAGKLYGKSCPIIICREVFDAAMFDEKFAVIATNGNDAVVRLTDVEEQS